MLAPDIGGTSYPAYFRALSLAGAAITLNLRLERLERRGNRVAGIFFDEYGKRHIEKEADQIVVEHGATPVDELYFALKPGSVNLGEIDHDALIANRPQTIVRNPQGRYRLLPHRRRRLEPQHPRRRLRRHPPDEGCLNECRHPALCAREREKGAPPLPRAGEGWGEGESAGMRLIDADALARTLDPLILVEALRRGHRDGDVGRVERVLVEEPGTANAVLTWMAWRPELGIAVKTATVFPGNSQLGSRPNVQSIVTLFDKANGAPLAAIHGESFTRMKTAANSALAADLLAVEDAVDARRARRRRPGEDPCPLSSRRPPRDP